MSQDNPTIGELGITGRAASALEKAGLTTRSELEAYGLDSLEQINGIGDDFAADIRDLVAASYPAPAEGPVAEPAADPVVEEAPAVEPPAGPPVKPVVEEPAEEPVAPTPIVAEPPAPEPGPAPATEPAPVPDPVPAAEPTVTPTVSVPVVELDDEISNARLERAACYALTGLLAGLRANPNPAVQSISEQDVARAAKLHAKALLTEIDGN